MSVAIQEHLFYVHLCIPGEQLRRISMIRPKTKILVDGGDPQETRQIKERLGFVDGPTTNPSLIAKNPHIKELVASGHKLSNQEEMDEYKKSFKRSPLWSEIRGCLSRFSRTRRRRHRKCSAKRRKCFRRFPMRISSIPARQKG
jgi:hypothetical protein